MLRVKTLIPIVLLADILVSAILLGMALGDWRLTFIACTGGILGFLVTDRLRWFRLEGMLANFISVGVLLLAMTDFFGGEGVERLVSVSSLLVYLQTIVVFQEKTPRLVWQILVLSLLQVVVSAIFSLDFEGGLLFFVYFVLAGVTMVLQTIYSGNLEILKQNRIGLERFDAADLIDLETIVSSKQRVPTSGSDRKEATQVSNDQSPILFFDAALRDRRSFRAVGWQMFVWGGITLVFTLTLFYMVPRHAKPWFGPGKLNVQATSFSKSMDLMMRGQIHLSNHIVFRASFHTPEGESVQLGNLPYFRGMALSSLVIENGKTKWMAPRDRVYPNLYQALPSFFLKGTRVVQTIVLEPTTDPTIYSTTPFFRVPSTSGHIQFCHEMSTLTRCHADETLDAIPYRYELGTLTDQDHRLLAAWPYVSNSSEYRQLPMSRDPPQQRWLTQIDRSRYPRLVQYADELVAKAKEREPEITRVELIHEFERFFLDPRRFQYTLDYRNVRWSDNLDPNEDFVRNIRKGHCELFASAMTLMLRSQGIPARVVVGFHGGDYSPLTDHYLVRGRHAHAWVEAYLRPEDCSEGMVQRGEAGPGGAWLRCDPTPPTSSSPGAASSPIELARTMWEDYVLGVDADSNRGPSASILTPVFAFLSNIDTDKWQASIDRMKQTSQTPWFQFGVVGVIGVIVMLFAWRTVLRKNREEGGTPERTVSPLRRLIANAISLISPSLGQWVMPDRERMEHPAHFYLQMARLLKSCGFSRKPTQTHREFAGEVGRQFSHHPQASLIDSTVREVTELFYEVRFGKQALPADLQEQIDLSLEELKTALENDSDQSPHAPGV